MRFLVFFGVFGIGLTLPLGAQQRAGIQRGFYDRTDLSDERDFTSFTDSDERNFIQGPFSRTQSFQAFDDDLISKELQTNQGQNNFLGGLNVDLFNRNQQVQSFEQFQPAVPVNFVNNFQRDFDSHERSEIQQGGFGITPVGPRDTHQEFGPTHENNLATRGFSRGHGTPQISGQSHFVQGPNTDSITTGQYGESGPNCEGGLVRGPNGECERPEIIRNLYIYKEPKFETSVNEEVEIPKPKVKVNLVVINSASEEEGNDPIIIPPAQEKTLVLVLDKKGDGSQKVIEVPENPSAQPEVFFVKYDDNENPQLPGGIDLQTALLGTTNFQDTNEQSRHHQQSFDSSFHRQDQHDNSGQRAGSFQQQQSLQGRTQQFVIDIGQQQQTGFAGKGLQSEFLQRDPSQAGIKYLSPGVNQLSNDGRQNPNSGAELFQFPSNTARGTISNVSPPVGPHLEERDHYSVPSQNQVTPQSRQSPSILRGDLRSFFPETVTDTLDSFESRSTFPQPRQPQPHQQQQRHQHQSQIPPTQQHRVQPHQSRHLQAQQHQSQPHQLQQHQQQLQSQQYQ